MSSSEITPTPPRMPEKISFRKRLAARLRGPANKESTSRDDLPELQVSQHSSDGQGWTAPEGENISRHGTHDEKNAAAPLILAKVSSDDTVPGSLSTSRNTSGKANQNTASTVTTQSFWARGYLRKKAANPDLILAYEALIADEIAGDEKPVPGPGTVAAAVSYQGSSSIRLAPAKYGTGEYYIPEPGHMQAFVAKQTASIQDLRWKIPFSEQGIDVQRQTKNIVRAILYARDAITPIASLEPHASIAWAGVCLVLPLLVNPETQKEQLTTGLEQVTSILCRLVVSERLYCEEYCSSRHEMMNNDIVVLIERFEEESVSLLADIIEYQARIACHTSRGPLSKYLSDVVKRDDWSALATQISDADQSCSRLLGTLNEQKYDRNQHYLTQRLEKLDAEVARITDVQQQIFNEVKQFSQRMTDGASEAAAHEILKALSTSNYERHKRVIPGRVPGTCQWFTSHTQYLSWKENSSSAALWLVADPGCGKSVLSKYLVDEELLDKSGRSVCYFFFKVGIEEQQGLERALCALLHQLFVQKRWLMRAAFEPFRSHGKAFAQSADRLWSILVGACSDREASECIFVLDGLDECDTEDRRELIRKISSYYLSNENSAKAKAKFLMTSRPYRTINENFQDLIEQLPRVHLSADQETAAIRMEIDVVVDYRVHQLAESLSLNTATAEALAIKLKAAENRTYLWLRLIFEVIEKSRASSKRELDRWVDSVPSTVQEAYAAILQRCENPSKARTIFEIILAAQSALTVQELNIALAFTDLPDVSDHDHDDDDGQSLDLDSHDVFHEKIRHICGLFVNIIDDRVYFIHKTAREFLIDRSLKEHGHMAIALPLSVTSCHLTLAKSCTKYLLHKARTGLQDFEEDLLHYASCSWEAHVALGCLSRGSDSFDELYEVSLAVCRARKIWWPIRVARAYASIDPDGQQDIETQAPKGTNKGAPDRIAEKDNHTVNWQEPSENPSISTDARDMSTSFSGVESISEAEITALSLFGLFAMTWLAGVQIESKPRRRLLQSHRERIAMQWIIQYRSNARARVFLWLGDQDDAQATDSLKPDSAYKVFWEKDYLSNNSQHEPLVSANSWNNNQDLLKIAGSVRSNLLSILISGPFGLVPQKQYSQECYLDVDASMNTLAAAFKTIAGYADESRKTVETFSQLLQRANEMNLLRELIFRLKEM